MLSAHHLEYSTLVNEQGDVLVFAGSYKNVPIALISTGFGNSAVLSCMHEVTRLGAAEVIYIGGCVSTIGGPTTGQSATDRIALRSVILAAGGSKNLLNRAYRAAQQYAIPVTAQPVLHPGCAHPEEGCIIDEITAALYEQARSDNIEALSILTVSENAKTGEKMEEHEKRSRHNAAARLVFETLASINFDNQHDLRSC